MSHPFRVFSEHTGHNYAPNDQRWNKVAVIRDVLRLKAVYKFEYVVYFDADLLFLDLGLNLTQIVHHYSQADIIMSDDSLDFANSGLIVVKNTPWSLSFFQRWWLLKDGAFIFCDQHALNHLSLLLEQEGSLSKVAVAPWWQLNSKWPSLEHFQSTNQILHLMGEYSQVRTAINFYIANSTCNASPSEFFIKKEDLLSIKTDVLSNIFNQHLQRHDVFEAFLVVEHVCEMQRRLQSDIVVCIEMLERLEIELEQDNYPLLLKSLVPFVKSTPNEKDKEIVFEKLRSIAQSESLEYVESEALLSAISYLVEYYESINQPDKAIEYITVVQIPREELPLLSLEVASLQITNAKLLCQTADFDSAISKCIQTHSLVKALQDQYEGERRILANVVNSFVSVCEEGLHVSEQITGSDAIQRMKYMASKEQQP